MCAERRAGSDRSLAKRHLEPLRLLIVWVRSKHLGDFLLGFLLPAALQVSPGQLQPGRLRLVVPLQHDLARLDGPLEFALLQ